MITTIILLGLLFKPEFADNGAWRDAKDVPVRIYYDDGALMPPQDIKLIHEKDRCIYGWKFNSGEWESMYSFPVEPEYYNDPQYGSNGGYSIA